MESGHQPRGKEQNTKQDKTNDQEGEDQEDQCNMSPFFIHALAVCVHENHYKSYYQRDQHTHENRHKDLPNIL